MKQLLFIFTLLFSITFANAQGCSDAGICSIGHAFDDTKKEHKNSIDVAAIYGIGEADVTYISPYITYTRMINDRIALSTKVTFSTANGSFGTRATFGDAYLIGNYTFAEKNNRQWSTLVGWKFPFTTSNLKINEYSLPLDYQASLGTFDLFLGTNFKYHKWDFNAAVQIPVFNNNKNSYFSEYSGTTDFQSTNLFQRKSDALLRATHTLSANKKFTFKLNILFIYHLGEDSYENIFGQRQTIENSDGLTINGNLLTSYKLDDKNSIELSLATPFVVREVRPDGLTRGFVLGLQYKIVF